MTNARTSPTKYEPEDERLKAILGAAYLFEAQAMKTVTLVAGGYTLAMTTWFQAVLTNEDFVDLRRAISVGLFCGLISIGLSLLLPFLRSRESFAGYGAIHSKTTRMLNRETLDEAIRAKENGATSWGYDNNVPIDHAIATMRDVIARSHSEQPVRYARNRIWHWAKVTLFLLVLASMLIGLGVVAKGVYLTGIA